MKQPRDVRGLLSRAAARTQRRANEQPGTSREDLVTWARARLGGQRVVVVSNREPYSHQAGPDGITWVRNAGGLTVALDAVVRAIGGVWVAHGSGSADRDVVDEHDRVPAPPDRPSYHLRRVWLTPEDHRLYYAGFSNSGVWPLCHIVYVRPRFNLDEWECYRDVNRRFADAVLEEIGSDPALVFLQDYHLALAAGHLKRARPELRIAQFWHIPWPNAEVFRRLPWRAEFLDGLLACDLLGFHIRQHATNFLQTVADTLEARVDFERSVVHRRGHRTVVRSVPIGVDTEEIGALADHPQTREAERRMRERLGIGDARIGLGVDRLDYTKGIPERLEALERFYEKHPNWIESFRFVQVGVPSRIELEEYRAIQMRTRELAQRINDRFAPNGQPLVHLIEDNLDFRELVPLYRAAELCAVTALHDGMNLVAKEYVAASPDCDGALILSPFTGAARELEAAWIASPYDREGLADAFHAALTEPLESRRRRMTQMREAVLRRTVFDWAIELLDAARRLQPAAPTEATGARRRRRDPNAGAPDDPQPQEVTP